MTNDQLNPNIQLPKSIYFVIVHWGDQKLTQKAVSSLTTASINEGRIIVVENGMSSGISNVILVSLPENRGYAGGVNAGIKRALELEADAVLVMNNDLEYQAGAVEMMVRAIGPGVGCVGALVDEGDGQPVCGGGFVSWWRGRAKLNMNKNIVQLDYVSGAFFLLSRNCAENVRVPEKYFHTWEDVAYGFELKKRGIGFTWVVTPIIRHPRSQSLGESKLKTYYLVRNGALFARDYAPSFAREWLIFLESLRLFWARARKRWEIVHALNDASKGITGIIGAEKDVNFPPHS